MPLVAVESANVRARTGVPEVKDAVSGGAGEERAARAVLDDRKRGCVAEESVREDVARGTSNWRRRAVGRGHQALGFDCGRK